MPSPSPAPLPLLASPRGAHARPAHSPSKTTSLRKRIAQSPMKKTLAPEFTTQWTPTRMSEQLKNANAGARKQRAWDREPRRKTTSTARTQKTIYKRFDRDTRSGGVTLRKTVSPVGKAVKKIRLDDEEGAGRVAAWDSPRRALPHKMPLALEDVENYNYDTGSDVEEVEVDGDQDCPQANEELENDINSLSGEAVAQDLHRSVDSQPISQADSPAVRAVAKEPVSAESVETPATTTVTIQDADNITGTSPIKAQKATEEDSHSASNGAEQDGSQPSFRLSSPTTIEAPLTLLDQDEETNDSDEEVEEDGSAVQTLPLPRIYTPHPGTFTVPEFDDTELTEDTIMEDAPPRPELEPQHPDLTSEITAAPLDEPSELVTDKATESFDATIQDATVTEALPSRLFNLPGNLVDSELGSAKSEPGKEISSSAEKDAPLTTSDEAIKATSDIAFEPTKEDEGSPVEQAEDDHDIFNLTGPATATADADVDVENSAAEEEAAVEGGDMFDIDVQSLKTVLSPAAATHPAPSQVVPVSTWMVEETTTTVQLNDNDDETVLRDFLSRSKANKAAKIARRSSLSNKRDSDAVRLALASPRKPLEEMDTNSPLMSPRKEQGEATVTMKDISSPTRRVTPTDTLQTEDDELARDTTMPPTRRSERGHSERALRKQAPSTQRTITVRREDHLVIKRSEAQELSVLTRANTRRNKGGSMPASVTLKRLQGLNPEEIKERAVAAAGERAVRWNEAELVSFFVENAAKDGEAGPESTGEAVPVSEQAGAASGGAATNSAAKPKARRVRALGAVNGTPAKKKPAPAKSADRKVTEAAEDEAPGEPTKSRVRSPRKAALAAAVSGEAEKHNVFVAIGAAAPEPQKPTRKSMVPRPRSSARLRKDA